MERDLVVTAFAARVRTGAFGRGKQVSAGEVRSAIAAISKTIELVGERSPLYQADNKYVLQLERCVEGMKRDDPPATPQLAVPVTVIKGLHRRAQAQNEPHLRAIADLASIAFFYLLRVGEYTQPRMVKQNGKMVRATRTVQFSVGNVGFFKHGKVLPRTSPLSKLLTADWATLKITNQKNGRMGKTVHNETIKATHGPVHALARRVHHILSNGGAPNSLLCEFVNTNSEWSNVTPADIRRELRQTILDLNLQEHGIDPDLVGVHSLRAGGAMAMKLHGLDDTTIMKQGRWTSLTFLMYIHSQIAHLGKDISSKMSTPVPFTNIACIEHPTTPAFQRPRASDSLLEAPSAPQHGATSRPDTRARRAKLRRSGPRLQLTLEQDG